MEMILPTVQANMNVKACSIIPPIESASTRSPTPYMGAAARDRHSQPLWITPTVGETLDS
jgi:hypothetical protein